MPRISTMGMPAVVRGANDAAVTPGGGKGWKGSIATNNTVRNDHRPHPYTRATADNTTFADHLRDVIWANAAKVTCPVPPVAEKLYVCRSCNRGPLRMDQVKPVPNTTDEHQCHECFAATQKDLAADPSPPVFQQQHQQLILFSSMPWQTPNIRSCTSV